MFSEHNLAPVCEFYHLSYDYVAGLCESSQNFWRMPRATPPRLPQFPLHQPQTTYRRDVAVNSKGGRAQCRSSHQKDPHPYAERGVLRNMRELVIDALAHRRIHSSYHWRFRVRRPWINVHRQLSWLCQVDYEARNRQQSYKKEGDVMLG